MHHQAPPNPASSHTARSFQRLFGLREDLQRFHMALKHLSHAADPGQKAELADVRRRLRSFEPGVTLIGQVKAGKTSLINALVGRPGLLPADINPWTSVITSLHIGPGVKATSERAEFHFFSEREWQNLLSKGGRVGELASRAGAEEELEKVRAQLNEMRAQSRARLGARFELLLGQTHNYGYVDEDLIQRYVCLGDAVPGQTRPANEQGRFADITRSADLYLSQPDLPIPLCLRDTPGVNDTFLVREQITVNAIRASRLCVVVLSAHQALSSVDMALIRLISNIRSRSVILFVNRIDELADPVNEIPQIRDSIVETLTRCHGPPGIEILFGSALWANSVLQGTLNALPPASTAALMDLAKANARTGFGGDDPEAVVWALSGVPALGDAISDRISHDEGRSVLADCVASARNIASAMRAAEAVAHRQDRSASRGPVDRDALATELAHLNGQTLAQLDEAFAAAMAHLDDRLQKASDRFVARACASLIEHLEAHGDSVVWSYDPAGLRMLLRSAYQVFAQKAERAVTSALDNSAGTLEALTQTAFLLPPNACRQSPPIPPAAPPPVLLGQTIALDIKGHWWTRWWRRRRSPAARTAEFSSLIEAEVAPVLTALRQDCADAYRMQCLDIAGRFLEQQSRLLLSLADRSTAALADLRQQAQVDARDKDTHLSMAERMLARLEHPRFETEKGDHHEL